jgi:hypothetical protein
MLEAKPWNAVPRIPFSLSRSFSRRVWSWSVLLPRRNTSLLIGRASISDRMMASNIQSMLAMSKIPICTDCGARVHQK